MNINKRSVICYDALWDSAIKCIRGVSWKPAVKSFKINMLEEVYKMHMKLATDSWKNGTPHPITITYPKRREGLSISIRDRVYQRSINDNILYPYLSRSFILDNCACQKGKGIDFARKRLKKHIWNHYCHNKTNGYVLQIDIKGYYPNMRHDRVKAKFRRYLDDELYEMVCDVLDTQYVGDVGYNPGSQMVQIAGISLLDDLDHYIKEKLHVKHYLRYMDDILIIHEDFDRINQIRDEIGKQLALLGFEMHDKKTKIRPLTDTFTFLGFEYRILETGKVLMALNSQNVKHERRKLRRMVKQFSLGNITKEKVESCFNSWCANAKKGNTYSLIWRMSNYVDELMEEYSNESSKINNDTGRASPA